MLPMTMAPAAAKRATTVDVSDGLKPVEKKPPARVGVPAIAQRSFVAIGMP